MYLAIPQKEKWRFNNTDVFLFIARWRYRLDDNKPDKERIVCNSGHPIWYLL